MRHMHATSLFGFPSNVYVSCEMYTSHEASELCLTLCAKVKTFHCHFFQRLLFLNIVHVSSLVHRVLVDLKHKDQYFSQVCTLHNALAQCGVMKLKVPPFKHSLTHLKNLGINAGRQISRESTLPPGSPDPETSNIWAGYMPICLHCDNCL